MTAAPRILALLAPLALLLACTTQSDQIVFQLQAHSASEVDRFSDWSPATNLGAIVNSALEDLTPSVSTDGLSLYFASFRAGGLGGPNDLWVSQRPSVDAAWGPPQNLGPTVNSPFTDGRPALSRDGHDGATNGTTSTGEPRSISAAS